MTEGNISAKAEMQICWRRGEVMQRKFQPQSNQSQQNSIHFSSQIIEHKERQRHIPKEIQDIGEE